MSEQELRLGDLIDDYCIRCKLLLNHRIASMVDGQVVKVICQTCYTEHAYRHGDGAKKKLTNPRATLFDQVLANVPTADSEPVAPAKKKKSGPVARYIARHKEKAKG